MESIKISEKLLKEIHEDLDRPHEFAFERVGFLYFKIENDSLVAAKYHSLNDADYSFNDLVGAEFSGELIREVMQEVLNKGYSVFQIHRHDHYGKPFFSFDDYRSDKVLIPSFFGVGKGPHGALLLSFDSLIGHLYFSAKEKPIEFEIEVNYKHNRGEQNEREI